MHNHIRKFKIPLLVISLFLMLNPTISSAGYRDWSTATQAGYVVEFFEVCQYQAGLLNSNEINKKLTRIRKHYSGDSQFRNGRAKAEIREACTNCAEICSRDGKALKRGLDNHISKINYGSTQSAIEKCQSSGRVWDYTEDVCVANTTQTTTRSSDKKSSDLETIEKKCTELGFTKGTEKHGDCVMKLYK